MSMNLLERFQLSCNMTIAMATNQFFPAQVLVKEMETITQYMDR
jgi:hypothetical protein